MNTSFEAVKVALASLSLPDCYSSTFEVIFDAHGGSSVWCMVMTQGAKLMAIRGTCMQRTEVSASKQPLHGVACWLENEGFLYSCRYALVIAAVAMHT